jgi:hypothetical protein
VSRPNFRFPTPSCIGCCPIRLPPPAPCTCRPQDYFPYSILPATINVVLSNIIPATIFGGHPFGCDCTGLTTGTLVLNLAGLGWAGYFQDHCTNLPSGACPVVYKVSASMFCTAHVDASTGQCVKTGNWAVSCLENASYNTPCPPVTSQSYAAGTGTWQGAGTWGQNPVVCSLVNQTETAICFAVSGSTATISF